MLSPWGFCPMAGVYVAQPGNILLISNNLICKRAAGMIFGIFNLLDRQILVDLFNGRDVMVTTSP
jgi:hypothetical protein